MRFFSKQFFYQPSCLRCGSFFSEDHLFCETCYKQFLSFRLKAHSGLGQVDLPTAQHFYLLEWKKNESDIISKMVYALKSDYGKLAIQFYANFFCEKLQQQINLDMYDAVVPLPGSKATSIHSNIFAECLAQKIKKPTIDILIKKSKQTESKLLNRKQRFSSSQNRIRLKPLEHFTQSSLAQKSLIYVDDILTTGNTFNASRQAIGNSKDCLLLTLFFRSKVT